MLGPLRFRIKMPGDPTKELPITSCIDVRRGGITKEDAKTLSQEIRQHGVHLFLILTDIATHPEALEELEFLPQIVLIVGELRDLIKLLVISFAQKRGISIDPTLLSRAYGMMFEKFGLREQIVKWLERMSRKGYLLHFEGFSGDTAKACRFFINSIGEDLGLDKCWELSWNIRSFLPFGIDSKIIPDMGLEALKKHAKVLADYGFLSEEHGKFRIQRHPSEERILELLQYYGGSTTRATLMKHFIFREATEHVFDSLLEHMERKLLIARESREVVRFLNLPEVKRLREDSLANFEQKKSILSNNHPLTHILTWKEREWDIISLKEMEELIERFLTRIATATDEDMIRSYTFLIRELIDWYGFFVDKINISKLRADGMISQTEAEIGDLERRFRELVDDLIKATKAIGLHVELQELRKAKDELGEIKKLLENPLSKEEVEELIKPLAGDKKSRDTIRKEKLVTDVDEELRAQGIRGDWTIPEYVLIKKKREEIVSEIDNLKRTFDSLHELSEDLTLVTEEISKLFNNEGVSLSRLVFTSILRDASKRVVEGLIRRSPFPVNISTVTITDFHQALDAHVSFLKEQKERAEKAHEKLKSLQKTEESFSNNLCKIDTLGTFFKKFWEEDVPDVLENKKAEILRLHEDGFTEFKERTNQLCDFPIVEKECETISVDIGKLNGEAERLKRDYEELFEGIKRYFRTSSQFVVRLKSNVVPKLKDSDKFKINEILDKLQSLYDNMLTWIEDAIKQLLEKNTLIEGMPKTRTAFHEEERNLREAFVKEVKDLDEESTLILMEIVKVLALHKAQWLSVAEVCQAVSKQIGKDAEAIKKTLSEITEKGLLTLGIGF
jgi:hypothetical protein